jgi:hypothetical protein
MLLPRRRAHGHYLVFGRRLGMISTEMILYAADCRIATFYLRACAQALPTGMRPGNVAGRPKYLTAE